MNRETLEQIEADAAAFAARHRDAATTLLDIQSSSADTVASRVNAVDSRLADITRDLINSGYFGLSGNVSSIGQAHERMGAERLAQVILAAWAYRFLSAPIDGYDLPAGDLWRHALGVSIASETLAETLKIDGAASVFLAGIFHDIGKWVLGPYVARCSERIDRKTEEGVSFESAEAAVLGVDHADLSGQILSAWSFPADLIQAVRWSHVPDGAAPPSRMADLLHVSNVLCLTIGIGMGKEGLKYNASPGATKRLNVNTGTLELVASHTLQWINELAGLPAAS